MAQKISTLNVNTFKEMLLNGGRELGKYYKYINDLNVFPVPDGDTGVNMKTTFEGGNNAIINHNYSNFFTLGKEYCFGLLMNARGNSGVICSQIFKGMFTNLPETKTELTPDEFVVCLENAKERAYKTVLNPVEGTILTVIRLTVEKIKNNKYEKFNDLFADICKYADEALQKTPDLLPELKEAGVVDSGGYGLWKIFCGMNEIINSSKTATVSTKKILDFQKEENFNTYVDKNDGFGYCTEFILTLGGKVDKAQKEKEKINLDVFKKHLQKKGDSIVIVDDEDIVKVHIHTLVPYEILSFASRFGEFNTVKIENMTLQYLNNTNGASLNKWYKKTLTKKIALEDGIEVAITVPSEKYIKVFSDKFDIKHFINTEFIGNPTVTHFVNVIKATKTKNVILVIDNTNYLFAANSAKEILSNHNVEIITCSNIADSYNACLPINDLLPLKTNIKNIKAERINSVVYSISHSIKDIKYSHINVKKGEYIGILNKKIIFSNPDLFKLATQLLDKQIKNKKSDFNKCVIFYGQGIELESAQKIGEYIVNKNKKIECSYVDGGQHTYHYYFLFQD